MTPRALVVATGDELVRGDLADANSAAIARALAARGWTVEALVVHGDEEEALARTVREAAERCTAVVVTGGLGPTLDDLTRAALARAAGVDLVRDEAALARLCAWFERRGRAMLAANERQALFPRGAEVLPNALGTADGFALSIGGARVFALPGPPREMGPLLAGAVLPRLSALEAGAGAVATGALHLAGLAESAFAELVGQRMARGANPLVGVTSRSGVLAVSLRATGRDAAEAALRLAAGRADLRALLAPWIYSEDEPDPARALGRTLIARGLSIALAESCTGGLVAARLTEVAGISAVFTHGFVTYSNAAKESLLGVPRTLLEQHGAVSAEVARAMARGAAERAGARLGLAVSGVAGPGGGTAAKPVGLVYLGVALDGDARAEEQRYPPADRATVREFALHGALDLARRRIAEVV